MKTKSHQLHKDALLTDKIDGQKDFRNTLKEIERRNFVIEDVLNHITDDELYIVVTQWPAFYKKYTETYGKFSPYQTPASIFKFLKEFVNESKLPKAKPATVEGFRAVDKEKIADRINELLVNKVISVDTIVNAFKHYFRSKTNVKKLPTMIANLSIEYLKNPNESLECFLGVNRPSSERLSSYKKKRDSTDPHIEEGSGLQPEKIPNVVKLGRVKIMLKKLYYDNILSVRTGPYKASIPGFSQAKVSEKMVQIILNLVGGVFPTSKDLVG